MSEPDDTWVAGAPIKNIPPDTRRVGSSLAAAFVGDETERIDNIAKGTPSPAPTRAVGDAIRDEPPTLLEFNPHDVPRGPARSVYILAHKWALTGTDHDEVMAFTYPDDIVTLLRELVASPKTPKTPIIDPQDEPPTLDPKDKPTSPGIWVAWGPRGWEDVEVLKFGGGLCIIINDDGDTVPVGDFEWNGPATWARGSTRAVLGDRGSVEAADAPGPARSIYISAPHERFEANERAASPGVTMVTVPEHVLLDAARMIHTQTRELHQEASSYEHTDERRAELEAIVGDALDLAEAVVMAAARGSQ